MPVSEPLPRVVREPARKRLVQSANRRWLEASIGPSPATKRLVIDPARKVLLPLFHPSRRLRRLRGHNQGGPLSVSFLGRFQRCMILPRKHFFSEYTLEETSHKVPFWRIDASTTEDGSDVFLIDGGSYLMRRLPGRHALVLPSRVDLVLDLEDGWEEVRKRFRRRARARVRAVDKSDFSYRVSREESDFRTFYRKMYTPTVRLRHGDLNIPYSELEAEVYFRHGFLFFVTRDGRDVAAGLCQQLGRKLLLVCYGVLDGDTGPRGEDPVGALQVLRIRWAIEQGFESLNFRSVSPCLGSGLFLYKSQWGSRVTTSDGAEPYLWMGVRRLTPAVRSLLEANPLIGIDERGNLDALIAVREPAALDEISRGKLRKRHSTPGLRRLLVYPTDSWERDEWPLAKAIEL